MPLHFPDARASRWFRFVRTVWSNASSRAQPTVASAPRVCGSPNSTTAKPSPTRLTERAHDRGPVLDLACVSQRYEDRHYTRLELRSCAARNVPQGLSDAGVELLYDRRLITASGTSATKMMRDNFGISSPRYPRRYPKPSHRS